MEELIFRKRLPQTAIDCRLCIPTKTLQMFPPFADRRDVQTLIVQDMEEEGILWNLDLYIQPEGHPKPVVAGQWIDFVRRKQLRAGDGIIFYRIMDANGEVNYQMRPFRNFMGD
ncbi:hypothetical protein Pint_09614 [Pistacia integerrima]|uniref:Uncharacterized protein n=1 Tax=Pistacia integerrima TaxID=434235 RepID=A0ACC0XIW9_9ROSI|nr:hypothetical protein Pint_09614 [Pistacia integerrima]